MRGNISWYTCKLVELTGLINGSIKIGKNVVIKHLDGGISEGLEIGDYSYLNENVKLYSTKEYKIEIGKYCSIANGVSLIALTNHDINCITTNVNPDIIPSSWMTTGASIRIGNDVRIGKNAIILKGLHIGTGAVIGAGAVVTKDIPPYAIAVGNPAKIIKYRFDKETIQILLESKRRNRDIKKIRENYNLDFIKNKY